MRIHFDDTRRPARVAKLLRAAFAARGMNLGLSKAQDLCARLYGYANYHELRACCGKAPISAWDEASPADVVAGRHAHHLATLAAAGLPRDAAEAFLSDARPTARARRDGAGREAQAGDGRQVSPASGERHRFADFLVANGFIGQTEAALALADHDGGSEFFGQILFRNGFISPKEFARAMSMHRVATRDPVPVTPEADEQSRREGMMERLVHQAVRNGASEINIEPKPGSYAAFYRRLGDRVLMHMGPPEEYDIVVSQLKDRSRMDLSEKGIGQDGVFELEHEGRYVRLLVATVPTAAGEVIIVRIFDPNLARPGLEDIGISDLPAWRRGINRKSGLCLICGETGSGRTTTLNASVHEIHRFRKKVYTAEDPVEYRIPYVGSVVKKPGEGYGFDQSHRIPVRAGADVVALGDLRDPDTALDAVRAAETGQLVIANLVAGSLEDAFRRLILVSGMEVRRLAFVLGTVMFQFMVRTPCGTCGGDGRKGDDACAACAGAGHGGRTIVSQCIDFADASQAERAIRAVLDDGAWPTDLVTRDIVDDGIDKMLDGKVLSGELDRLFGDHFRRRCAARGIDPARYVKRGKGP